MNSNSILINFTATAAGILLFSFVHRVESKPNEIGSDQDGSGPTSGQEPRLIVSGRPSTKLTDKFNESPLADELVDGTAFGFDDWADAADADGWLCRDSLDCTWIDANMECSGIVVSVTGNWPAGFEPDSGYPEKCGCKFGWTFDSNEAKCNNAVEAITTFATWIIIVIVVSIIVALACCVGVACCCVKGFCG